MDDAENGHGWVEETKAGDHGDVQCATRVVIDDAQGGWWFLLLLSSSSFPLSSCSNSTFSWCPVVCLRVHLRCLLRSAAAAAALRAFLASFHATTRLNAPDVSNRETAEAIIPYAKIRM